MSCNIVRQRLLASERPDKPAAEEARHLANCAGCRSWLRRLAHLEQLLSLIPVPASSPPPALIEMLQAAPLGPLVAPTRLQPSAGPRREGGRQKLALSLSLAATLALFALGWWALPHTPVTPPAKEERSSLVKGKRFRDVLEKRLKEAQTPPDRVMVVADLAGVLLAEAQAHPRNAAGVARLARDFRELMDNDLKREADKVSFGDRAVFKTVAGQLGKLGKEAAHLAGTRRYAATASSLREMAAAASEAELRLRAQAA
jgi:hypothetical protein